MESLSRGARAYLLLVLIGGVGALWVSQLPVLRRQPVSPAEWALFVVLAVLFGGQKISVDRRRKSSRAMSITLGFAVTFASLARFGPGAAVPVSVLCAISSCLYPKVQKWPQLSFNAAWSAVEALAAGGVYICVTGHPEDPLRVLLALVASVTCFFLLNTGGVAVMVSLCTGEPVLATWMKNFAWTAPSYFTAASIGALISMSGRAQVWILGLFMLPVAVFIYQLFVTHLAHVASLEKIKALHDRQAKLASVFLATTEQLALAIDAKDQHHHQHIVRVQRYAVALAESTGIDGDELQAIKIGALLHDIGKLGVPDQILRKRGSLTSEEMDQVRRHAEFGAEILRDVEFPWPVHSVIQHHHERWDGSGYPEGLRGDAIPRSARVVAIADVYDALTSDRSYRAAMSHDDAVAWMGERGGIDFDPELLKTFVRIIGPLVVETAAAERLGHLKKAVEAVDRRSSAIEQRIQRASTELWAMYEVTRPIAGDLGVRETVENILKRLSEMYPGTTSAFLQWDEETETLRLSCVVGEYAERFTALAAEDGHRPAVRDLLQSRGAAGDAPASVLGSKILSSTGPSTLIVPVLVDGAPVGTMNLYHVRQNAFTEYDQDFLRMVADRSASAIYNAVILERTQCEAFRDHLTSAYNGRAFEKFLQQSRMSDPSFALLCIDLDCFKPINDVFGHREGDRVLKDVAAHFARHIPQPGNLFRCGGDEFAIILPGADAAKAAETSKALEDAIDAYDPGLRHEKLGRFFVGASIGVAFFPSDARELENLVAIADRRMYDAKARRKAQISAPLRAPRRILRV